MSLQRGALVLLLTAFLSTALAQQNFVIGTVNDGPSDRLTQQEEKYVNELLALTESEFNVEIRRFSGSWSLESTVAALNDAYADPDVDMVLAIGFTTNQIAATKTEFSKPTFLPIILDTSLLMTGPSERGSGIRNLNYLTAYADFEDDLDVLASIVPYRKLVLFVDENLAMSIPQLRQTALDASNARGIELLMIPHDGTDHALMNRVPADTDAIFVAGLPRMPQANFDRLIDEINIARIPSYSFAGVTDVERGLLATNAEPRDVDRQARLNALNMQAVMLGERAEDQPIAPGTKDRLTINLETARKIGVSPTFDVLNQAVLLNQTAEASGTQFGLVDVARIALEQNQDLQAESFGLQAGLEEISRARSSLLPQLGASANYTTRNDSPSVEAGLFPENRADAALNFDQLIYSDAAVANLTIQKELQRTRLASYEQFRLDVVQAATSAYYTVLNARSQLRVQDNNLETTRANLELARDRVAVGTSTRADIYRWEAETARARIQVLDARAQLNQSWETLNRILHRPQGTRIALREASFSEPFIMTRDDFDKLVRSPADYNRFSLFYIERALRQSPELEQLNGQIAAKRRELVSQKRSYWLPDFSLTGQYTSNLTQSGIGAGMLAGEDLNDWNIGVQATLPLFAGGLRRANVSRAEYELRQLESLYVSTSERVEEEIRNQLHAAQAAYAQIDLTEAAAEASLKNFELVSDAYAAGTVSVIDLLDAQDTSRTASAAAAESLHNFLITIMAVQRAVGGYDYLLSIEDREALAEEFRRTLTGTP